ncbi:MAG: histidine phosphatase family protein [Prolixibacteraceae bacterium]
MIRLTVIRHGETTANASQLCQGQQPGELSEKGIRQVKLLAERMRNEPIDILYSSDLKRTMDTAHGIIAFHPGLAVIPDPLLRERYMASWEGKALLPGWKWEDVPVEAETNEAMMNRAILFIDKIMSLHDGKHVVAVSHGGMIRAFRTLLSGSPLSQFLVWEEAPNTSISRFELHGKQNFSILEVNNAAHL